ncbi:MAG: (2Fe-2S) ferredoxin domain-containing protein [Alkalicoccus sp.]|nr:MAG: (2Fe-2S) ferredoxin domain-containing protein [Alkalicoccus sp.]
MATWNLEQTTHHVFICNGSSCTKAGAEELTSALRSEIAARELDPSIHTTRTLCAGRCQDRCVVVTYPDGHWYQDMDASLAGPFVESLSSDVRLHDLISHSHNGRTFERTEGALPGTPKNPDIVKKVSKL